MSSKNPNESLALKTVQRILDVAIDGVGPMTGADVLARQYLDDAGFEDGDARVTSFLKWESSKSFGVGFVTGLGGLATLPLTLPAGLVGATLLNARVAATVAGLYAWDLHDERVRTFCALTMLGDGGKEIVKDFGVQLGTRVARSLIDKVPGKVLIEINKRVGFRLLTKAGEKGLINLIKGVPLIGGVVGGTIDATGCWTVGRIAQRTFRCQIA
jgi:hypothetical protein